MTEDLEAIYRNEELKQQCLLLHRQGMTADEIEQSLHVSPRVVQRWLRDIKLSVPRSVQCPICGSMGKLLVDIDSEMPTRNDTGSPFYYCFSCRRIFPHCTCC